MADVALIRKRLRSEIDRARRASAERREHARHAAQAYDTFLESVAVPVFRQFANVLRAEGVMFEVQTPSGGVRLSAERNRDDGIALELDTLDHPPQAMLIATRTWGGQMLRSEKPVKERTPVDRLTEEDLLERLFEEIRPWLA